MKTGLIIAVVIIAVVVIGFFFFQQGNQDNNQVPELSAEEEAKLDTANGEPTMQSETKVEIEPLAGSISPYYEFDKELYDK
ncbi:hypothetical protein HYV49_02980, partial [Candidatus Pacearchaeota archaeon]|nr:hypothetical protein [Candidatus Pacearchaeota archaeon]